MGQRLGGGIDRAAWRKQELAGVVVYPHTLEEMQADIWHMDLESGIRLGSRLDSCRVSW